MEFALKLWNLFLMAEPRLAGQVVNQLQAMIPAAQNMRQMLALLTRANPDLSRRIHLELYKRYGDAVKRGKTAPPKTPKEKPKTPFTPIDLSHGITPVSDDRLSPPNRGPIGPINTGGQSLNNLGRFDVGSDEQPQETQAIDCEEFLQTIIDTVQVVVTPEKDWQCTAHNNCDWVGELLTYDDGPIATVKNALTVMYLASADSTLAAVAVEFLRGERARPANRRRFRASA